MIFSTTAKRSHALFCTPVNVEGHSFNQQQQNVCKSSKTLILTFTVFNLLRASQEKVRPELPKDTSPFLITDNLIVKYRKSHKKTRCQMMSYTRVNSNTVNNITKWVFCLEVWFLEF